MGFLTKVWASLSWENTHILKGTLGGHHFKCIRLPPSLLIYLVPRRGLSCRDAQPDVGRQRARAEAGRPVTFLLRFIRQPGYALINICQVLSHRFLHLWWGWDPVWLCPAASQVKCAAPLEIILISRGHLDSEGKAESILPDFGQAPGTTALTPLQPWGGLSLPGPKEDPVASKICSGKHVLEHGRKINVQNRNSYGNRCAHS